MILDFCTNNTPQDSNLGCQTLPLSHYLFKKIINLYILGIKSKVTKLCIFLHVLEAILVYSKIDIFS